MRGRPLADSFLLPSMFPLLLPCEIEYIKTSFIRQYGKCNYRNSISRGAPKAKGPAFRAGPHCRGVRSPLDSNLKCSTKSVSKAQRGFPRHLMPWLCAIRSEGVIVLLSAVYSLV